LRPTPSWPTRRSSSAIQQRVTGYRPGFVAAWLVAGAFGIADFS